MLACGIFSDVPPNFDPNASVWRYRIKWLGTTEQRFLVDVRLTEIFLRAVERGESKHLREVIVIDEGAKFASDDDRHIINVIALEARKFGLGIWFASQSPTHYPEALMTSMATKVILGIDSGFWPKAQTQLKIDPSDMAWIRPQEGMLIKLKVKGLSDQKWKKTIWESAIG